MEDSPTINKLMTDRDKLLDKIQKVETQKEKLQQIIFLLRERNFRLRQKLAKKEKTLYA